MQLLLGHPGAQWLCGLIGTDGPLAALIAGAALRPTLWPAPGWMWRAGAWTACVLLGLRGLMGLTQTALGQAGDVPWGVIAADPLFLLGGVLFGAVARSPNRPAAIRA